MIKLKNISKSFVKPDGQKITVLNGLNLTIDDGEFVAIVGPSGSGKSTLMNILGLLSRPDSGQYSLCGDAVEGLNSKTLAHLRNQYIGFVFQQFHLLPRATACENVSLPLIYSNAANPREMAAKALCRVGLEERIEHFPNELSGGQQQRVAIARAIVNQPNLILADEPTGNLDPESAEQILGIFEALNQSGATILMITHDREIAERASRIMVMDQGNLGQANSSHLEKTHPGEQKWV